MVKKPDAGDDIVTTHHGGDVQFAEVEKGEVIDAKAADAGLKFLAEHGTVSYTEDEEAQVQRRIDSYLLPLYFDKATLAYAAVYGLRTDLGLVGQQYSWATSIFYFGYLVGQWPGGRLLQRLPLGVYISANLFLWGALVMCLGATQNFAALAAIRFLMGIFESCIVPCSVHITGMWYTYKEQGVRFNIWYSAVGFASLLGGLITYGIGHAHSSVANWRLIFLVCGGITIVWAVVIYFVLPDTPASASFLTERQRMIAVERLRQNRTGVKTTKFKWSQAWEALRDPQIILLALYVGIGEICNIGGSFLPLILQGLGFSGLTTTLLTMPGQGVQISSLLIGGVLSYLFRNQNGRLSIILLLLAPTYAGCIMLQAVPQNMTWVRAVACWMFLSAAGAPYAVILSLISSNVAGFSKKVTATTLIFIVYCVGDIVSPQMFLASEAPTYPTGLRTLLVARTLNIVIIITLGFYYYFENKRRDAVLAGLPSEVIDADTVANEEFLDRTDKEDFLKFRYKW
ncbi:hypothetical protein BP6252_11367 [Coleophoma cylindrospora]|uniref:Major facilitator superfamily (MFS) profile domain-containing protein n=1 Tax=Coleophoma cylindrospora TaxID=1849047 RepID=A0A3D8QKG8_9HELO|nr:hypothetical protein BP6252_11367 [Coleophoma cylindrospora]